MRIESVPTAPRLLPLQPGIVYGPVRSRRLGLSLGINLLPTEYKLCSFNCIYCQYGWTSKPTLTPTYQPGDVPRPEDVYRTLERVLKDLAAQAKKIDCLTFSGNGEPTLHPDLGAIIDGVKRLRDRFFPIAKVAILSNSSTVTRKEVREALRLLDVRVMKLDAGSEALIRHINAPARPYHLEEIVSGLKQLRDLTLQSMFVQGRVTNTDPHAVSCWIKRVKEIDPTLVQIYSLDRAAPDRRIRKVNPITLHWIASQVRLRAGVAAEVY